MGTSFPFVRKLAESMGTAFPRLKCPMHYDHTFGDCCALKIQLMHPATFQILINFRGLRTSFAGHTGRSAFGHAHPALHAVLPSASAFQLYEMTTGPNTFVSESEVLRRTVCRLSICAVSL